MAIQFEDFLSGLQRPPLPELQEIKDAEEKKRAAMETFFDRNEQVEQVASRAVQQESSRPGAFIENTIASFMQPSQERESFEEFQQRRMPPGQRAVIDVTRRFQEIFYGQPVQSLRNEMFQEFQAEQQRAEKDREFGVRKLEAAVQVRNLFNEERQQAFDNNRQVRKDRMEEIKFADDMVRGQIEIEEIQAGIAATTGAERRAKELHLERKTKEQRERISEFTTKPKWPAMLAVALEMGVVPEEVQEGQAFEDWLARGGIYAIQGRVGLEIEDRLAEIAGRHDINRDSLQFKVITGPDGMQKGYAWHPKDGQLYHVAGEQRNEPVNKFDQRGAASVEQSDYTSTVKLADNLNALAANLRDPKAIEQLGLETGVRGILLRSFPSLGVIGIKEEMFRTVEGRQRAIALFTKKISGAQFSVKEQKMYSSLFPDFTNPGVAWNYFQHAALFTEASRLRSELRIAPGEVDLAGEHNEIAKEVRNLIGQQWEWASRNPGGAVRPLMSAAELLAIAAVRQGNESAINQMLEKNKISEAVVAQIREREAARKR